MIQRRLGANPHEEREAVLAEPGSNNLDSAGTTPAFEHLLTVSPRWILT
jgi:hypothetical protein